MNYGFIKACAVSPALRVADCPYNAQETIEAMQQAAEDAAACRARGASGHGRR